MNPVIPAKAPVVKAEPLPDSPGLVRHVCKVPGCGWTFTSVKSALDPIWHRAEHRKAAGEGGTRR